MTDADHMRRALRLARRGRTSPNPMVGAVVVKDGCVVGEGYHPRAGEPHAEVFALRQAGEHARGAAMYVTLEPCCHHGRTPPCTEAVIAAGIRRVVAAMADPDPNVSCRGFEHLRSAGVEVEQGLCEAEARELNAAYIKHRTTGMPLVTLKWAMSLDGKIATRSGDSKWITGESARRYVHRMRSRTDAILVGGATARADNPALTARLGSRTLYPRRVVLTASGDIAPDLAVVTGPGECIIATSKHADGASLRKLADAGARILTLEEHDGRLLLDDLMRQLAGIGVLSVLIEGGGEAAASALEARVVDRIVAFCAPRIIGGRDATPAVGGLGAETVASSISLERVRVRRFGDDIAIEGDVVYDI